MSMPARWLNRRARKQQRPNDLATIIFSSGSTGTPKGVMLSHHNIISNVEAIGQVIQFTPQRSDHGHLAAVSFLRLYRDASGCRC